MPRSLDLAATLFALALAAPSAEASLADRLHRFVQDNTSIFVIGGVADFVTPAVQRLAVRGIDFPSTSTAPGFAYQFDFESSSYVRIHGSAGPVFAERPETIGRRHLELGASFLWGDLDQVDGGELGTASTGRFQVVDETDAFFDVATSLTFDEFSLRTSVWGFSATYGLTDRWDVNVLLPLMYSRMSVEALRRGVVRDVDGQVLLIDETRVGVRGEAFGPGDVLLRSKYRLLDASRARLAVALALRAPSGSEDDFQGLGDWTVTPMLVAGSDVWRTHLHASLGFEANADDLERSRVRYAVGATVTAWRQLSVFADVLGSSGTADDEFVLRSVFPAVEPPSRGIGIRSVREDPGGTTTIAFVPRSDVVDIAAGLKAEALGGWTLFAGVIVPVTDDGLRAAALPAAGVQYGF